MKKRIFAKITAFVLLMTMLFSINVFADGYNYGYYVDNVEYIGDGKIEATIVFASNTYGSDVDVKGVGVLAIYDETQAQILGLSSIQYNETSPFLNKQRFSVTQTVSLTDLTLERYVVKFILLESMEDMKPAAYVSTGTNAWVLEGDEIEDEPTDNPPSSGGSGGGGYLPDEDSTDLVIDPELFVEITSNGNIKYYKDVDAETENISSKIETPFTAHINMTPITLSDKDTVATVAWEINSIIGRGSISNITATNHKAYRFIDTDNNGKYDKLVIENSASFVVGKVNATNYQISKNSAVNVYNSNKNYGYGDYATAYSFTPLDLNTEDGMVSYTIKDTDGKALSFGDIKVGDVLNVAMSVLGTGEYHYDIVVSTAKAVTGTITKVKNETVKYDSPKEITYYTINGTAYRVNGAANAGRDLEAGTSGTFYLTNDNAIISCDITKSYSYGIVIATGAYTGTFECGVQAQIMSLDGEVLTLDFAETVSVFTSYYEKIIDSSVDSDWSMNGFQAASELLIAAGTIVIYETNSVGEIRRIYVDADAIKYKDDATLAVISAGSEYEALTGKIDGKFLTEETVIIAIPSAAHRANKDKYSLVSLNALADEEVYEGYLVYNSEKEVKLAFITNLAIRPSCTSSPMVVTDFATVWFEEETRYEYTGLIDGQEVSYVMGEEVTYVSMANTVENRIDAAKYTFPIEKNDVIQVVINENNEIISYRHLLNWDNGKYYAMISKAFNEDATRPTSVNAKYVELGTTVSTADAQIYGAAVADRAYKVGSSYIEFETKGDITYDSDVTAYIFGSAYAKAKVTTLDSAELLDDYENAVDVDDIIYLYSYDGENVFAFIWDVKSDNR